MESARIATAGDFTAIEQLAGQHYENELPDARGGPLLMAREARLDALPARLQAAVEDPAATLIVGCYDGVVLGYGLAWVEELADGRRLGLLDDLLVDTEARDSGIGEAIMNLMLTELTKAGCFGVDSRALPGDRHTKNFFESFGLKARLLIMHRDLEDAPFSST